MSTSQTTSVDNIANRVPEGFYQHNSATKALGWPEDSSNWAHLISVTHANPDNYYALQFSGGFFDNDRFYIRKTAGDGNREWRELYHSGNLPALAFDDAAKLRQLGWTGDTNPQKLSSRYDSLAAAQAVFPSAQKLDEYIDGCAVERVIQLNRIFYNRSSIRLPPGGTRVSRTIDTQGAEVSIIGSGRGVTHLILMNPDMPLIKHGLGPNLPGPAGAQRQFQIANLCLKCESPDKTNTTALDISYYEHTGVCHQTSIRDVDIVGFSSPIRIRNPNRGLAMDTVGIYGPDSTVQPNGAIEIITDTYSTQHSGQGSFKSVRIVNYRWGWDVQMDHGDGSEATRRSMEGFIFNDCGLQNGWGLVKARNNVPTYYSLLWQFIGCDWQGYGYALDMEGCNQVIVSGGYWIANHESPIQDPNPPGMDIGLRRYFRFGRTENITLERMRIDVAGDYPAHVIVDIEPDCKDVLIKDCIVRNYSTACVAGFRLGGFERNTVREIGTIWQAWPFLLPKINENDPNEPRRHDDTLKIVDVYANQISQTRANHRGGTCDENGHYFFSGRNRVQLNGEGNATINLPRKPGVASANGGSETPIFAGGGIFLNPDPVIAAQVVDSIVPISIPSSSVWEFTVSAGSACAWQWVTVAWTASGR